MYLHGHFVQIWENDNRRKTKYEHIKKRNRLDGSCRTYGCACHFTGKYTSGDDTIIKATTVHIPVIIGAILLGPLAGAILGGVFGICSMLSNTYAPTLLSFAFSPFMSTTGLVGAVKAIWVSIGCRILIGVVAGWAFILLKKIKCPRILSYGICGFLGAMTNTVAVMGSIYLLFAQQYAQAKEVALTAVFGLVMGTVTASGIPEAICATILVALITKALVAARLIQNQ